MVLDAMKEEEPTGNQGLNPRTIVFTNPDDSLSIGSNNNGKPLSNPSAILQNESIAHPYPAHAPPEREQGSYNVFSRWRTLLFWQQACFFATWLIDIIYLITLIAITNVAKNKDTETYVSGAGSVFVGHYPADTSLAFAIGALFTDILGLVSAYYECTQVMTLLLVWDVFFTCFAPGRIPIFFLVMRGVCFATGVEWRFAVARHNDFLDSATIIGLPIVLLIGGFRMLWGKIRQIGRRRTPVMHSQDV